MVIERSIGRYNLSLDFAFTDSGIRYLIVSPDDIALLESGLPNLNESGWYTVIDNVSYITADKITGGNQPGIDAFYVEFWRTLRPEADSTESILRVEVSRT
jgi:hypothetical protein